MSIYGRSASSKDIVRPEPAANSASVRFAIEPAYDLLISLAAAANAERYEMPHAWAQSVKDVLPPAMRRDLALFFGGPSPLGTGPVQLVPDLAPGGDAGVFLDALGDIDPYDLGAAILVRHMEGKALRAAVLRTLRTRATAADEAAVQKHLATLKAETRKRWISIAADPLTMSMRYLALLRAHHDAWFAREFPSVLPVLEQRARQGRRYVGKMPLKDVIARATGGFTLASVGARSVTLIPSYYASPFVYVVREGRETVLVYGARPPESETAHAPLDMANTKVLKVLADETRLRILGLLAQKSMYGQQLADSLGISHATVSHHMAQLRVSGLTRTELAEDGMQMYHVRPQAIQHLCSELTAVFVLGSSDAEGR